MHLLSGREAGRCLSILINSLFLQLGLYDSLELQHSEESVQSPGQISESNTGILGARHPHLFHQSKQAWKVRRLITLDSDSSEIFFLNLCVKEL